MPDLRILASPALSNRTLNPYNYLLYSNMSAAVSEYTPHLALTGRFNIFHLHWPDKRLSQKTFLRALLSCLFLLASIELLHLRGCKVVWTVHNLGAHDCPYPNLQRWFYKRLIRKIDGYLILSSAAVAGLRQSLNIPEERPIRAIPHGHYRDIYPASLLAEAREKLGISVKCKTILFFGQLKPYKNVPALIKAFRGCSGENLRLLIVGSASQQTTQELSDQIAADDRISLYPRHVADDEVQLFFGAADLVVLPYREILNSGTALLALSFNKPVLVPDKGAMRDLASSVQPGWVQTYEGDLAPFHLSEALTLAAAKRNQICDLNHLNWNAIAQQTLDFFVELTQD